MSTETNPPPPEVKELMGECLARMETEGESALEAFCAEHPEHADTLRRWIALLDNAGLVEDRPSPAATDDSFPERLGDFRLLRKLGAGGMGVVYLARQESVGRDVALKLIRPELLYFDRARTRFQREVESVGRLKHPGIVSIHAVGEADSIPYFAMEFVEGCSLAEILLAVQDRPIAELSGSDIGEVIAKRFATAEGVESLGVRFGGSWVEACFQLIRQAAVAVEHAHQNGVLHRDLKPSNIMVTPDGRVVILDFGLASIEGSGKLTMTGSRLGSLDYMSPEQVRGESSSTDRRSDIYALGVTLYEMLTLHSPFAAPTEQLVRNKIVEGQARSIRSVNRAVPWDAETVCLTAMESDPRRRYASTREFAVDLDNFLALRPIMARRPGALLRLRRWAQRSPARAVAAMLAVLLVVGGPLGYAWITQTASMAIETERDAAELSLQFAFEALQKMGTELANTELKGIPRAEQLRRKVLLNTLQFYERFLAARGEDPRMLRQTALAQERVCEIHWLLGDFPASRDAGSRAIELCNRLLERNSEDFEIRLTKATQQNRIAAILIETAKYAESEPRLRDLNKEIRELLRMRPDHVRLRAFEAQVLHNLSIVCNQTGKQAERNRHVARSVEIREALHREDPDGPHGALLIGGYYTWALYLRQQNRLDESDRLCERALKVYQGMTQDQRHDVNARNHVATIHTSRGASLHRRGKYDEARRAHERALELRLGLVKEFPTVPTYQSNAGASLSNIAAAWQRLGEYEKALSSLDVALGHQRRAVEAVPDHRTFRRFLFAHHSKRAGVLRALGRHQEAVSATEEAVPWHHDPPAAHYWAAQVLATCAAVCSEDEGISVAKRTELQDSYGRRAAEFLRLALARRKFDLEKKAFDPFRGRADFRALVAAQQSKK